MRYPTSLYHSSNLVKIALVVAEVQGGNMKRGRFVPSAGKAEKYSNGNTKTKFFTYSNAKPIQIRNVY